MRSTMVSVVGFSDRARQRPHEPCTEAVFGLPEPGEAPVVAWCCRGPVVQLLGGTIDARSDGLFGKLALNHDQVETLREEKRSQRSLATISPYRHVRMAQNLAVGVAGWEPARVVQAAPRVRRIDNGASLIPDQSSSSSACASRVRVVSQSGVSPPCMLLRRVAR